PRGDPVVAQLLFPLDPDESRAPQVLDLTEHLLPGEWQGRQEVADTPTPLAQDAEQAQARRVGEQPGVITGLLALAPCHEPSTSVRGDSGGPETRMTSAGAESAPSVWAGTATHRRRRRWTRFGAQTLGRLAVQRGVDGRPDRRGRGQRHGGRRG